MKQEAPHYRGSECEDAERSEAVDAPPFCADDARRRKAWTTRAPRLRKQPRRRAARATSRTRGSARSDVEGAEEADDDASHAAGRQAQPAPGGAGPPAEGRPRATGAPPVTAQLDAKLRQLAEFRGVDLNAAASVAIAEDWRRCFGSPPDRS
jgi:hypothetical protein